MRTRILLAVALFVPAIARAHEGHEPLPTKGATVRGDRLILSASAAKAIGVTVAKVQLAEVQRLVHAVGSVELPWSQQAFVTSLIPGKVTEVLVKPGEMVAAGQELARVESLELENLQLAMLQASSELGFGSRLLDQQEDLGAEKLIPGKTVLETRTRVRKDRARLNSAWQKLLAIGLARDVLQNVRTSGAMQRTISITSPIAGTISAADVRPGQMVEPTEHLFHVVDLTRVWIVGKVLEADGGRVRAGQWVHVRFSMFPEREFAAQIDHVELRLNPDRTLSVKSFLDNPDRLLKAGMFCRMEIQSGAEQAVVCPKDALVYDRGAAYALVLDSPGNYLRKAVQTGQAIGANVEITDGLFPGDKVVTTGSHELAALFASAPAKTAVKDAASAEPSTAGAATIALARIEVPTDQKLFAAAPIDGRIAQILVEHGQKVTKGQPLAKVQSLGFLSLQLDLLEARATLAQAGANLERLARLAEGNAIAKKDLWETQNQHDVAKHSVETLRRKLSLMGLSTDEIRQIEETDIADLDSVKELSATLTIRAPGDGLIAEFDLVPGQVVAAQRSLFEIHNPTRMWVHAYLFEQDAVGIRLGQSAEVRLVSDPAFRAAGKVDRLSPVLVSGNRAASIWIELDNPGAQLKEDMSAVVTIRTGKPPARLAENPN